MSNLLVQNIKHTNNTTAMSVDSSGRVTRGVIPSWRVGLSAQADQTAASADIVFDKTTGGNCFVNGGITYDSSTGLATVPIAGLYMLGTTVRIDGATTGNYILGRLLKNNVTTSTSDYYYHLVDDVSATYHSVSVSGIFDCSASDNLRVQVTAQSDTSWHVHTTSLFWGYLVG